MTGREDMTRDQLRALLYEKYIAPTKRKRSHYIGAEIEIPTVNLQGGATDHRLTQRVFVQIMHQFGFKAQSYDRYGVCYSATNPDTGDNISFDCSYNNLEFSFGREDSIRALAERFKGYISFLNTKMEREHHLVTGMGVNPNHHANRKDYLTVPRYQMLEGYLRRGREWKLPMYIHPYAGFGTYASASQVQLDVTEHELIDTLRAQNLLEPVKAVLFSNSWMDTEPDLLCVRDLLWENSSHGINPHNIGMYERVPESIEELIDYLESTSLFCAQRDDIYCHFYPIPANEYFNRNRIEAEYYWEGVYHQFEFEPEPEDLALLRTYKFEDVTFRGTVEYRSCCSQPFSEAFTVAAFHYGLAERTGELLELLGEDRVLYGHGYSPVEMRRLMNRRKWPEFIDRKALRTLCFRVLDLAKGGLLEHQKKDEEYLEPLYERADKLTSPARIFAEGLEQNRPVNEYVYRFSDL